MSSSLALGRTAIAVTLLAASCALAALLLIPGDGDAAPSESTREISQPALPVESLIVTSQPSYETSISIAGRIRPKRRSALGFERVGRIAEVLVDEGDAVETNQVLAQLDTRELRAKQREAKARIVEVAARLDLAKLTTARQKKLRASKHISQQKLDEARFDEAAIAASLASATAVADQLAVELALSQLVAPYAGQIVSRTLDEGAVAGVGQPVLELIEGGALEMHVGVPPDLASDLVAGARFRVEVRGSSIDATLIAVLADIEPETQTVGAIFSLAPESGARAGDLGRIELTRRIDSAGFWLPLTALAEGRRGLWNAYAIVTGPEDRQTHQVESRLLEVLHTDGDRVFVRGLLKNGDEVVATGLHRLVPHQRVRASKAPAPGEERNE